MKSCPTKKIASQQWFQVLNTINFGIFYTEQISGQVTTNGNDIWGGEERDREKIRKEKKEEKHMFCHHLCNKKDQ
jgi:hypothetical protein